MTALAGIATVDITPPVGIALFAYHRPEPSQGVLDRLYATALYLELDSDRCLLVSIDHVGMAVAHVDEIRAALAADLNLTRDQLMICFTHTHSGPDADADTPTEAEYRQSLRAKLRDVALQAANRAQPCTVGWSLTHAAIGVNRREHLADGTARHGVNPDGPVDDRIGVLSIHHRQTRQRLGVVVICTAHGNVLKADNLLISGDFPGWTRNRLAADLDCPALMLIGAAGDCNPRWRGSANALEQMAQTISQAVLNALPEPQPVTRLSIATTQITLALNDVPDPERAAHMAHEASASWEVDTQRWLEHINALYAQGQRQLACAVELQALCINDGVIMGMPMEPFAEYALKAAQDTRNDLLFLTGYTNGILGYLPRAAEIPYGGYEINWMPVIYGLETGLLMPVQADAEQHVLDAVRQLQS